MNFAFIAGAKVAPFIRFASFLVTFFQTFLQGAGKQKPIAELFLDFSQAGSQKQGKTGMRNCKQGYF